MFRRNGYTGTGVKQVAAAAGAQLGSLYHFFPGGKDQLAEEVIRTAGPLYGDLVYAILDPYQDLETAITEAFALAAQDLAASGYADACPIATIALEVASTNDHLRQATADVFTDWISRGAVLFARHGLDEPTARRLTIAMIAALEGAFVLARALRDPEPLHAAGASAAAAVRQALDQAADSRGPSPRPPGGAQRAGAAS
jgi:AcrR family transcriptional regulator